MAYVLRKALIEPQVVPPFHRHQISEPVMGQFMHDGVTERKHSLIGDSVLEQIQIIQCHDSCILHGTPFVFMGKDLIILWKRVRASEVLFKKLKGLVSHLLNVGTESGKFWFKGLDAVKIHR